MVEVSKCPENDIDHHNMFRPIFNICIFNNVYPIFEIWSFQNFCAYS
jgi:hypothetical protein